MMKAQQRSEGATANLSGELLWLGRHSDVLTGDVVLVEIRIKVAQAEGAEHMAVVKAWCQSGQLVGFVTAPELDVLVHLVAAKLQNGTMKWREDRPYGQ